MHETALNDLTQKIRNLVRDFEHEQAANDVTVRLRVEVADNTITVQAETAYGGPVIGGVNYTVGNGDREMFVPATSGVIADTEGILSSLSDVYIRPGNTSSDDTLPRLDEPVMDTENMIVPPGALSGAGSDVPTYGYQYDDAPGKTFSNPAEHEAWQRQQKRSRG